MIRVRGLTKRFGGASILDGIDLDVAHGERVVIIGPSGTGKSTLLRCLNLLEMPDAGRIEIDGVGVEVPRIGGREALALRRKTSFVFQNYALFANKTACGNVAEGLIVVRRLPRREAMRRAGEILSSIGLGDKGGSYPAALSGGQQQRVGIARAMALEAPVMLFDEPTSSLDPEWVEEVLGLMRRIAGSRQTMVIVTHEMRFAAEIADRVVFMEGGRIVEEGPPAAIFSEPADPRTRRFLRQVLPERAVS